MDWVEALPHYLLVIIIIIIIIVYIFYFAKRLKEIMH